MVSSLLHFTGQSDSRKIVSRHTFQVRPHNKLRRKSCPVWKEGGGTPSKPVTSYFCNGRVVPKNTPAVELCTEIQKNFVLLKLFVFGWSILRIAAFCMQYLSPTCVAISFSLLCFVVNVVRIIESLRNIELPPMAMQDFPR